MLSLRQPLGSAVDLAFAALDLAEAREELEWARPELADRAPVRLPQLDAVDDLDDAVRLVSELITVAIDRLLVLDDDGSLGEAEALGRALRRLSSAAEQFARSAA